MKYAKFVKLGGELIEASRADYPDYYGFLVCPECSEPVFLRKEFERAGKPVRAAFVHHRAVPEVSACELRVGWYSQEDVLAAAAEARNQRLKKLETSMWKFIKSSAFTNIEGWTKRVKYVKKSFLLGLAMVEIGEQLLALNNKLFLEKIDEMSAGFQQYLNKPREVQSEIVKKFIEQRGRDWTFHGKIAKEALELFLEAPQFADIRNRLVCVLCHPDSLKANPYLLHLKLRSSEWLDHFNTYIVLCIVTIFCTIDWVELLKSDTEDSSNSVSKAKGFGTHTVISKGRKRNIK